MTMSFFKKAVEKVEGKATETVKGFAADDIMKYIKGINFPASLQAIISAFKNNNAPAEMTSALGKLPDMTYNSPQDLINTLKK